MLTNSNLLLHLGVLPPRRTALVIIAMFIGVIFAHGLAFAHGAGTQEPTGTLSGVVVDQTGSFIAEVDVIVAGTTSGLQRSARTNAEGSFLVPLLPPGQYVVTAQREGFAAGEVENVVVSANDTAQLKIELKVASVGETVMVTAQKRGEERLQDVPVPIAVLDAQRMVDSGELRLRDYYSEIPGLTMSPDGQGRQYIAIRGIADGRASIPTVGTTIDDVSFICSVGCFGINPDVDPGDLSRIEVLRGPQGTLYGPNSMGGLIRYVLADPSTERLGGRVSVGLGGIHNGNDPGFNVRGAVNIPMSDTFAVRVSGYTRREPGYVDNPVIGKKGVNTVNARGGLLMARWRPSPLFSMKLSVLHQNTDADGLAEVDVAEGLDDLQQTFMPGVGQYEQKITAFSARIVAQLGKFEVTSLTGYTINKFSDAWDDSLVLSGAQYFPGASGVVFYDDIRTPKVSQEVRVASSIGKRMGVLLGGFYTHDNSKTVQRLEAVDQAKGASAVVGTILDNYIENPYSEYSGFATLTYAITEKFDVQLGGRRSHVNPRLTQTSSGPLVGGVSITPIQEANQNVFTYLLTPRYKMTPELMVYGRLASGYRPGGTNSTVIPVPRTFDSDKTQNYEIGLKGEFLDHRLSLDTSVYYIDWKDIQLRTNTSLGFGYLTNASRAKSAGVELAVAVRPLAGLTIDGWVTYNDAVLTEPFPTGSPVEGTSGDRLPFSTRWSSYLSLQQSFPLSGGIRGFVGGDVNYIGDRISNFRPTGVERQYFPSYVKTDVRAGVTWESWSANLFVNNVGDERGIVNVNHYIPIRYSYIQPRAIGLNLVRSF